MKYSIKSCQPINAGKEWRVRLRLPAQAGESSGREIIAGIGAGYTMHQAQIYADSIRRDYLLHGILP